MGLKQYEKKDHLNMILTRLTFSIDSNEHFWLNQLFWSMFAFGWTMYQMHIYNDYLTWQENRRGRIILFNLTTIICFSVIWEVSQTNLWRSKNLFDGVWFRIIVTNLRNNHRKLGTLANSIRPARFCSSHKQRQPPPSPDWPTYHQRCCQGKYFLL